MGAVNILIENCQDEENVFSYFPGFSLISICCVK